VDNNVGIELDDLFELESPTTTYKLDELPSHANVGLVNAFDSSTSIAFAVDRPEIGDWTLRIRTDQQDVNPGEIRFAAYKDTAAPTINILSATIDENANTGMVRYLAKDRDSDAKISFFYNNGADELHGVLIAEGIVENDSERTFEFNPANWPTDAGHIAAIIDDGDNSLAFDAIEIGFGHISGQAWRDLDNNGRRDVSEPALGNWAVFIDSNANGHLDSNELTTRTDAGGQYAFRGLTPGTYQVRQVVPPGWAQSFPAISSHIVEIARGFSLALDGSDDVVQIDDHPALSPTEFTVELWFKPQHDLDAQTEFVPLLTKLRVDDNFTNHVRGYDLYYSGGAIILGLADANVGRRNVVGYVTDFAAGQWHHLAASYGQSGANLYINGQLVASGEYFGPVNYSPAPIVLGSATHTHFGPGRFVFRGEIDEVRLWDRPRTGAEIQRDARRRLGGDESGLVGYWPFDEGSGTVSEDYAGGDHPVLLGDGTVESTPEWTNGLGGAFTNVNFAVFPPRFTGTAFHDRDADAVMEIVADAGHTRYHQRRTRKPTMVVLWWPMALG
jgi:hypothetical protein